MMRTTDEQFKLTIKYARLCRDRLDEIMMYKDDLVSNYNWRFLEAELKPLKRVVDQFMACREPKPPKIVRDVQ